MLSLLSQITIKVALSQLLRIPEHKRKTIAWEKGVDNKVNHDCNTKQIPDEPEKELETKVFMSQIPPMYLDDSVNQCLGSVDHFFLTIIINRKTLKNYMVDSGASNTVMPFEVMKEL